MLTSVIIGAKCDTYDIYHQYENYDLGQPPTGPEYHHFFGQGGFDPFGKLFAKTHVYGGPQYDLGPIRPVYVPYRQPHNPYPYASEPVEVYSVADDKDKGVFKQIDSKIKEYTKKFSDYGKDKT